MSIPSLTKLAAMPQRQDHFVTKVRQRDMRNEHRCTIRNWHCCIGMENNHHNGINVFMRSTRLVPKHQVVPFQTAPHHQIWLYTYANLESFWPQSETGELKSRTLLMVQCTSKWCRRTLANGAENRVAAAQQDRRNLGMEAAFSMGPFAPPIFRQVS